MVEAGQVYSTANQLFVSSLAELSGLHKKEDAIAVGTRKLLLIYIYLLWYMLYIIYINTYIISILTGFFVASHYVEAHSTIIYYK